MKETIISKGKYVKNQPHQLILARKYIFTRSGEGRKQLLLSLENGKNEACTKYAFILCRLDARGNLLGETRIERSNAVLAPGKSFSLDMPIEVEDSCTDFTFKLLFATYGDYTYHIEGSNLSVTYSEGEEKSVVKSSGDLSPRLISRRAFSMPWIYALIALVMLAMSFVAVGYSLSEFIKSETEFTLSGIQYEFVDDNKETGDVVITGCSDMYKSILITSEIEGHRVVGVKTGAFVNNSTIKKIRIEGVDIDEGAFKNCISLESVEIHNAKSVGAFAFESCPALSTVTITADDPASVIKLGECAFNRCSRLNSVSIEQFIEYPSQLNIFNGCDSLSQLRLKNMNCVVENSEALPVIGTIGDLFGGENMPKYENGIMVHKTYGLESLEIDRVGFMSESFCINLSRLRTVKIGSISENKIPDYAFYGCSQLESIELPSPTAEIGRSAFDSCGIKTIDLSAVSKIGAYAFCDASRLESLVGFESSVVTEIEDSAFFGCASLKEIKMPSGITYIGDGAFASSGLTRLELWEGVSLGSGIIEGCASIEYLALPNASVPVGVLFGADGNTSASIMYAYIPKSLKEIKIESGTVIGDYAFCGCSSVEKIQLPSGITAIGDYALFECKGLRDIELPSTLKSLGQYALAQTAIESLTIPGHIENIGYGVISDCNSLKSLSVPYLGQTPSATEDRILVRLFGSYSYDHYERVPMSLNAVAITGSGSAIDDYAFYCCSNISSITIPSNVSRIGSFAFYNCSGITTLDLSAISFIGDGAFQYSGLASANMSSALISIGNDAFSGCGSLTTLSLGDSVAYIGNSAFYCCYNLTSITLPSSLETIGDYAFSGSGIKDLTVPNESVYVGVGAIAYCEQIESISFYITNQVNSLYHLSDYSNFPSTLKRVSVGGEIIGSYAMEGCVGVREIIVREGVTDISSYAFPTTRSLKYLRLPSTLESLSDDAFTESYTLFEICNPSEVEIEKGEGVGTYAIEIYSSVEDRAPTLTRDGYTVAKYADKWYLIDTPTGELTLPDIFGTVVSSYEIPPYLFYNNDSITSVAIPKTVTAIGHDAFYSCDYLTDVTIASDSPITEIGSDTFYECCSLSDVTLPSGLKTVSDFAFYNCISLKEIALPSSLEQIGSYAFSCCNNLCAVTLGSSLTEIGESAFDSCYALYDVYNLSQLPIVEGSDDYGKVAKNAIVVHTSPNEPRTQEIIIDGILFRGCGDKYALMSYMGTNNTITLGEFTSGDVVISSYRIRENAFSYNSIIKNVTITKSVKAIGDGAFYSCNFLETVVFEDSATVKEIGNNAFYGCTLLKVVELCDSVETIGQYAFGDCYSLEQIKMPSSLKKIESNAFIYCARLISVTIPSGVTEIGSDAFYGCSYLFEVYDLSGALTIKAGDSSNGYVGYNALKVFTSEASALQRHYEDGCHYIFLDGAWYLYTCDIGLSADIVEIASLNSPIYIMNGAFTSVSISALILPSNLSAIGGIFNNTAYPDAIYYAGTRSDWSEVDGSYRLNENLYFYSSCVHNQYDREWTYVDGVPSTETCALSWSVAVEPSCTADGERVGKCQCKGCDYTEREIISATPHQFEGDTCTLCEKTRVLVNKDNYQTVKGVIITADYFEMSEDGYFVSTNHGNYSEGTLTIQVQRATTITLTVEASSEAWSDYGYVYKNGEELGRVEGFNEISLEINLKAGDKLTITYEKDSSASYGDDCIYVKSLYIMV